MVKNNELSIKLYARLLRYVAPYWMAFVVAIAASICYSSIDAWLVHFLEPLLNKGFIDKDVAFIEFLPFLVVIVFVVRATANIGSNFFMTYVARSVVMVFRQKIFRKYQQMPAMAYDTATSGNLLSAIIYNVEQVANASADALTTFLQSIILVIGLLVVIFSISWQLALIYFISIPLIVIIVGMASKRIRRYSLRIQESMGGITSIAEENIEGYKVVRTFGGQTYEQNRFDDATVENRRREMKVALTKAFSISGVQIVAGTVLAVIIYLTTSGVTHDLSAGAFTALISAMLAILKPMKDLANVNSKIQRGLAAAHTIFGVLDSPSEVNEGVKQVDRAQGEISFKQVSFSYPNSEEKVLSNIDIEVKPGEIIALVGRSGSGKTTLVNLLMRFYELSQGAIHLDGEDVNLFELKNYREQFAFVSQHTVLFNDTVANNIAYGSLHEKVSKEDIVHAAKVAHAIEFIDDLADGFDTLIGEDGLLLSGGQRQRLALARAVLKRAPILVLDEATSALDTESEKYIQDALDKLMHQCTTIVIAHRLSTIKQADSIIVMDKGHIVEQGKHDELLAKRGHYAKLYEMQFQNE